jgi:hypothetical protein
MVAPRMGAGWFSRTDSSISIDAQLDELIDQFRYALAALDMA